LRPVSFSKNEKLLARLKQTELRLTYSYVIADMNYNNHRA